MTRGPREDERPVLVGRFVYYEPLLPAAVLARQARRLRMRAQLAERLGDVDAHPIYRAAIERFVDAFLVDRPGEVDCFTEAHLLGRYLEERFGCPMQLSDDGDYWTVECGVPALHSRFGSSYGGANLGRCSLCGADDFQCDHVPGRFYDGRRCYREVYEVNLDEVSVVQSPEDSRTYRLQIATPMSAVLEARGRPLLPSEVPMCTHCTECPGADRGPTEEDIDPSLWPPPAIGGS
jgi:hypothetical protein